MAHFAKLDKDNYVIEVIVVANDELLVDGKENEAKGISFCESLFGGQWVQTSYNGKLRKQFAGLGFQFDSVNDVFIAPRPFPSWSLDDQFDWQPPTPKPDGFYFWNEDGLEWVSGETL